MVEINKDIIKHVADVARINLTEKEVEEFLPQFKEILSYFSEIQEVNTDDCKISLQPVHISDAFREDEVKASLSTDEALANTEHKKEEYFKGPKAI